MQMYLYKQYQDKSGDMYYITILCYSFILITLGLNLFQAITVWEFGDTVTKNQVLFNSSIEFFVYVFSFLSLFSYDDNETTSSLYSLTILAAYYTFAIRLDKVTKIGPYVKVFQKIVNKSFFLLPILFITLIAFLLSFDNNKNTNKYTNNNNNNTNTNNTDINHPSDEKKQMSQFKNTFEFNLLRLLTWSIDQVSTEQMGVESIQNYNLVNF
jgi:hypothetical protein